MKQKLNKQQKSALKEYNEKLRAEDRFLGSVFVNPVSQKKYEDATLAAYKKCKDLGIEVV
jgi:hypothetical protein